MKTSPVQMALGSVRLYRMRFWLKSEIVTYGDTLTGTATVAVIVDPLDPGTGLGRSVTVGTPVLYGVVQSLAITAGGSDYNEPPYTATNQPPTISITGGGASSAEGGAQAVAIISKTVASVTVTAGGAGYTSAPAVTFDPPVGLNGLPVTSGVAATGTAVLTGTAVASVTVTNAGSGYTSTPGIHFDGGAGVGAAAAATMNKGVLTGLTITSPGRGYTSAPTVAVVGGDGSGATVTAAVQYGEVRFTLSGGSDVSNYRVTVQANTAGGSTLVGVGGLEVRADP